MEQMSIEQYAYLFNIQCILVRGTGRQLFACPGTVNLLCKFQCNAFPVAKSHAGQWRYVRQLQSVARNLPEPFLKIYPKLSRNPDTDIHRMTKLEIIPIHFFARRHSITILCYANASNLNLIPSNLARSTTIYINTLSTSKNLFIRPEGFGWGSKGQANPVVCELTPPDCQICRLRRN